MAQCLLACGAVADFKTEGMRLSALGLARQFANNAGLVITAHWGSRGEKRKRKTITAQALKKKEDEEREKRRVRKTQKQEQSEKEKEKEKELEGEVRRLAKLQKGDKLDMFTLRQMVSGRGALPGDLPKRKLALLQLAVDWFTADL